MCLVCVCVSRFTFVTYPACVCLCVHVRIMACLFICRLTPGRPFLLISAPASLFRSPPSWLVMKTPLSKRQVLCLEASKALRCDIAGGHHQAYPLSATTHQNCVPNLPFPFIYFNAAYLFGAVVTTRVVLSRKAYCCFALEMTVPLFLLFPSTIFINKLQTDGEDSISDIHSHVNQTQTTALMRD